MKSKRLKIIFWLLPVFLLFRIFAITEKDSKKQNGKGNLVYAVANFGLPIHIAPDIESPRVYTVEFGEPIKLGQLTDKSAIHDDIPGKWVKVKYKNYEGYSFTGFIGHLRPSKAYRDSIDECLISAYGKSVTRRTYKHKSRPEEYHLVEKKTYSDNIYFERWQGMDTITEHLDSPIGAEVDAYYFLQSCFRAFDDLSYADFSKNKFTYETKIGFLNCKYSTETNAAKLRITSTCGL